VNKKKHAKKITRGKVQNKMSLAPIVAVAAAVYFLVPGVREVIGISLWGGFGSPGLISKVQDSWNNSNIWNSGARPA
jgi:hypothetical protein